VQGHAGSLLGGDENYVGVNAAYSSVSGGTLNQAHGWASSILGGQGRTLPSGGSDGRSQAGATVFAP